MTNLQKRILTSIIIFPLSIFITLKGGNILASFLLIIFFLANYELFSGFKKKSSILFLDASENIYNSDLIANSLLDKVSSTLFV